VAKSTLVRANDIKKKGKKGKVKVQITKLETPGTIIVIPNGIKISFFAVASSPLYPQTTNPIALPSSHSTLLNGIMSQKNSKGLSLRYMSSNKTEDQSLNFTHVDPTTNQPSMVDVSDKQITKRTAQAISKVRLPSRVIELFQNGDITTPKGPVFNTAIIAATFAAKRTSDLIPFCHPLPLEKCKVHIQLDVENKLAVINVLVSTHNKTGVEMEALTGASVAALTIYDMCKSISHDMAILEIKLIKKTGGKSDINQTK
jgi:cyclic pyranopterin phosphate synthase